jgi:hypothetical protein
MQGVTVQKIIPRTAEGSSPNKQSQGASRMSAPHESSASKAMRIAASK